MVKRVIPPLEIARLRKWRFLEYYLSIYTTIITKNFERCYYIDGLAGQGKYDIPPFGSVDGSPLRALRLKYPFTNYFFIEKKYYPTLENNVNDFLTANPNLKTIVSDVIFYS